MKASGKFVFPALLIGVVALSVLDSASARTLMKKDGAPKEEPNPVVVVETPKGNFKILVYKNEAPITAGNFLELVQTHLYDKTTFHRYEPKFCIQGGDPTGTGRGGSGKTIPLEINKQLKHSEAGMVGMAHAKDKNSASSQFYIILSPQSGLDNDFAVFGKVTEGLENVFAIRKGDTMDYLYIEGSKKETKKEVSKESKQDSPKLKQEKKKESK